MVIEWNRVPVQLFSHHNPQQLSLQPAGDTAALALKPRLCGCGTSVGQLLWKRWNLP